MQLQRKIYIKSNHIVMDKTNGALLLSRSGTWYPALPYKEGVSIHPPVTMLNQGDFKYLIDWCIQNSLRIDTVNLYNVNWMTLNIISLWLNAGTPPTEAEASTASELKVTHSFLMHVLETYISYSIEELEDVEDYLSNKIKDLQNELIKWYRQEFLKIRYGGMYSYHNDSTLYFRISSTGFDWTPIIKAFCTDMYGVDSLQNIWVGLDFDSRGSDRRYFEGTVNELFETNLESEIWANRRKFH